MSETAIKVENLSKVYRLYDKPMDRLKESIHPMRKKYHKDFYALNDVSFEIKKGETVGIIGKNGSGKSTLLKIITGVLTPSAGSVEVNGKVSALLELGAGFNPEFTGIENIYLNGTIMGYTKEEMDTRLDDILSFADIGDFVHQPVKMYSSGMFVRLAFAVAISVEPDILIVDEALSVGDMYFQLKCINKIKEFKKRGKTILFVTHDVYTVRNICNYAVWINGGEIELEGEVECVVNEYEKFFKRSDNFLGETNVEEMRKVGKDEVLRILNVAFYDKDKKKKSKFKAGEDIVADVEYEVFKEIDNIVGGIAIFDSTGYYICGLNTKLDKVKINNNIGKHQLTLEYPSINLLPGTYFIDIGFFEDSAVARLDYKSKFGYFNIDLSGYLAEGVVLLTHNWSCD